MTRQALMLVGIVSVLFPAASAGIGDGRSGGDSVVVTVPQHVKEVRIDGRAVACTGLPISLPKGRSPSSHTLSALYEDGSIYAKNLVLVPGAIQSLSLPGSPASVRRIRSPVGHGYSRLAWALFLGENWIASIDMWGEVVVRDASTGEERMRFHSRTTSQRSRVQPPGEPSASSNGKRLLVWITPRRFGVFEAFSGHQVRVIDTDAPGYHARISQDGTMVHGYSPAGNAVAWSIDAVPNVAVDGGPRRALGKCFAISPNGDSIAVADEKATGVAVLSATTGQIRCRFSFEGWRVRQCHFAGKKSIAVALFDLVDKQVTDGSGMSRFFAWDVHTHRMICDVTFETNRARLVVATDASVAILDFHQRVQVFDLEGGSRSFLSTDLRTTHEVLCVDQSGKWVAICDVRPDSNDFRILSIDTGDVRSAMKTGVVLYHSAVLSRNGRWLVGIQDNRRGFHIWDCEKGVLLHRIVPGGRIVSVDPVIAGELFAVTWEQEGGKDSKYWAEMFNAASGDVVFRTAVPDGGYEKQCSANGRFVAWMDGDETVKWIDLQDDASRWRRLENNTGRTGTTISFLGESTTLAVGDSGGGVTFRDLAGDRDYGSVQALEGQSVVCLHCGDIGANTLAMASDGSWALVDSSKMVRLSDFKVRSSGILNGRLANSKGQVIALWGCGVSCWCDIVSACDGSVLRHRGYESAHDEDVVAISQDGGRLIVLKSGILEVMDTLTGDHVLSLFAFVDEEQWCVVSGVGVFDGTDDVREKVGVYLWDDESMAWRDGGRVEKTSQLLARTFSGERVRE